MMIYRCNEYFSAYAIGSAKGQVAKSEVQNVVKIFSRKYNLSVFDEQLIFPEVSCDYTDYVKPMDDVEKPSLVIFFVIGIILIITVGIVVLGMVWRRVFIL